MDEDNENVIEEWMLDEVTGMKRKPQMNVLNRQKLSRYELDDLFLED
jgi:hypothetical protein